MERQIMTGAEIIEAYRNQSERSLEEMIDAELIGCERAERKECAMRWEVVHGSDKNGVAAWLRSLA